MAIAMVTVFLSSCEDDFSNSPVINEDEILLNEVENEIDIESLPSKEIQIFDETGKNSITLKVSAEDKSLLDLYSEKTYNLKLRQKSDMEIEDRDINTTDYIDNDPRLHDLSVERPRVYIGIVNNNIQNSDLAIGLSINESEAISLRAYNHETLHWIVSSWDGITVKCKGRGIDGLSAYAYHSKSNCSIENHHFSSRYFYSSGTQNFFRGYGKCRLYVKVVHYNNFDIWAFR